MTKPERVQELIDALRSKEFKQGRDLLTRIGPGGKEFDCCLGVACKVYLRHNPDGVERVVENKGVGYDGNHGSLPNKVTTWFGFQNGDGSFRDENKELRSLSGLNDSGWSFKRIAELIESYPKELFTWKRKKVK